MTIGIAGRSADGEEYGIGLRDGPRKFSRKSQAIGLYITLYEFGETGFEKRDFSGLQHVDALVIFIDAGDPMAEIGETSPGYEANVAGSNDHNVHFCFRATN